ncbi:rhomboid family intramembrane serine protease [Spirosoma validum]|uniref:Rhomboid family intramembrane serine protease n=1 Tax=Spirosoma validum TaxID=2771355 RepID=A0A927GEP0_9BACT|nr:rhomboid family intramembrane serine protease [Spirosoma validum]MBD2754883.1 rhomboid family intramembrane serine protease [Spirosoma validum]
MFNLTPVVRVLLILNVVVFLFTNDAIIEQFGLHSFLSDKFNPIQLLTHMFLHGGFGHIFSNMIGLVVFGPMLELFWGPRRFTFFYFFCGLGAALLFSGINYFETHDVYETVQTYRLSPGFDSFSAFVDQYAASYYERLVPFLEKFKSYPNDSKNLQDSVSIANRILLNQVDEPMVGASGAIFGVIMGFGLLFPNTQLFLLFPPIPIKAKYLVIFYGAYELYSGIYRAQSDNVAHFAHIGGMLFAFILVKYWGSQRKTFY